MKKVDLNGLWQFKAIDRYRTLSRQVRDVKRWMNASVPGTVHTDLLANKKIADPFYRMNEKDVQWVDGQQWHYQREFVVPEDLLEEDVVELVAKGLDTYATIVCNGKQVAQTANMFMEHRLDIRRHLKPGRNQIDIVFDSPTQRARALERRDGRLRVGLEPHRVYARKAQYSFGWDWGPKLTTSGIWRDIYLEAYSVARIRDAWVKLVSVTSREAVLDVIVETEHAGRIPLGLRVGIDGEGLRVEREVPVTHPTIHELFRIPRPNLWWPNGYGDQAMYSAFISMQHDGIELDSLVVPFGIRTVRLVQERDEEGKSFIFEINGKKIYCKGANWIPSDNFIPRIPPSTYEKLLIMAKDAHMNMIRVWGGGIYEQDRFYELCDRLGLMVWQDFMFACGEYPEEPWFLNQVQDEVEKAVKRLRNHPSIVLWCGNNECEWLFCTANPGKSPDDISGAKIFRDVLPAICEKLDGTRPYWRSSPFGEGFPNSESNGNHHQWIVWSSWKDYKEYEKSQARFVTEFGFQAPANRRTLEEITLPSDRDPQSEVMEHHNKQVEGTERLFRFQLAHYRLGRSFDSFIYKGQLVQAEALKYAVEHWRRRKFKTAGALFWQLNDCWPVSSWAVVDSALRPKAAYYYARKFFAPILVSFRNGDEGLEVWGTNDRLQAVSGSLQVKLLSFDGKRIWTKSKRFLIGRNSSGILWHLKPTAYRQVDPRFHYVQAELRNGKEILSENRFFFVEPKHMQLPEPKVTASFQRHGEGLFSVKVQTDRFVKNIRLEVDGEDVFLSDNYFDIDPGESREVTFRSGLSLAEVKKMLRIRWL